MPVREENREARQGQIEEAAYDLLREQGYAGTSMLRIAQRAKASNETLYRWYGDKAGLFRALVQRNAAEVKAQLEQGLAGEGPALETLRALGPRLLALLTSPRAVALNQAAAADASGALGKVIAQSGRDSIAPLIQQTLQKARDSGALSFSNPHEVLELYLGLLVGDLQIRRAIGRLPPLDNEMIEARADRAFTYLCRLLAP